RGDERVVHVSRAEAPVHAAIARPEERAGILDSLRAADLAVLLVVVARDEVGIAASRVLRADRAERERSGDVAVTAVDEDGADLATTLEDGDGLAHRRGIPIGNVQVVAAAVHGDD